MGGCVLPVRVCVVASGSTNRGRGWGQPLLLCVVMAASELMGARVFVWEDCVGVCAA